MFNIFLDAALTPTSFGGWILARSLYFKRVVLLLNSVHWCLQDWDQKYPPN